MNIDSLQFVVLFGKTGSGKSDILRSIQENGGQVLDLEKIAAHNGSSFGALNKTAQPSQVEFEEIIEQILDSFSPEQAVWVEYESGYLGKLQLPKVLLQKMNTGKMIVVELDREKRIERIVKTYSYHSTEDLLYATSKLKKKLSYAKYRLVRQHIRQNDYQSAVSVLITYYDKVYDNVLHNSKSKRLGTIKLTGEDITNHTKQIMDFYQSCFLKSRNPE